MELTVNTVKFIEALEGRKKHYLETQEAAKKVYSQKVEEYNAYVKRCVTDNRKIEKAAPYLPTQSIEYIQQAIEFLGFHTEGTVKVSSVEFENIMHNVGVAITSYSSAAFGLESLNYN